MSTTPQPVPAKSFVSKLETDIVDIAKKVKAGLEVAEGDAVKVAAFLAANQSEINSLAALAGPAAAKVTSVGSNLLNLAINAVKDAGSAASANAINVSLDQNLIADVKLIIAAIEKV